KQGVVLLYVDLVELGGGQAGGAPLHVGAGEEAGGHRQAPKRNAVGGAGFVVGFGVAGLEGRLVGRGAGPAQNGRFRIISDERVVARVGIHQVAQLGLRAQATRRNAVGAVGHA
nr:hypothetical protein [Tanacetum cinerariifolium]